MVQSPKSPCDDHQMDIFGEIETGVFKAETL